jgi:hypothetical protein
MEQYHVTVEEPIDIIASVYETKQRADDSGEPVEVVLDHQEDPNVVRGYGEPLVYPETDSEIGDPGDDGIVRRPDGGLSWYHSETGCYMRATPGASDITAIDAEREDWMDELTGLLQEVTDADLDDDGMDIYTGDGDQIAGASSDHRDLSDEEIGYSGDADLQRACWYDSDSQDEDLDRLLEQDGIDPDAFYDSIAVPEESLLEHLADKSDRAHLSSSDFISDASMEMAERLQDRESGHLTGSCVMSEY